MSAGNGVDHRNVAKMKHGERKRIEDNVGENGENGVMAAAAKAKENISSGGGVMANEKPAASAAKIISGFWQIMWRIWLAKMRSLALMAWHRASAASANQCGVMAMSS
jgi:hypothetical protein